MILFWRALNGLVLLLAVALTWNVQAQWKTPFIFDLAFWLWVIVLSVWTARLLSSHPKRRPKTLLVPVSLILMIVCEATHLPMRVLFWTQQSALQGALSRAEFGRQVPSTAPRIGILRPIDISKAGRSTRFLFWQGPFISDEFIGFAHCPDDAGCSRTSFPGVFAEANGEPTTMQLNRDWVAIRVSGSDF